MPTGRYTFCALALAIILIFSSSSAYAQDSPVVKLRTVVLDAGHGGNDPGAVAGGLKEKDVNLDVVLRLGRMIEQNYPEVKVIYTRKTDVFVPLGERSRIANRNRADLFISVHVNSAGSKTAPNGTETFVMGTDKSASNMEVCKRENSVIMLEDDYTTQYAGFDPSSPDSYIFFNLMQNAHMEQSIILASLIEKSFANGPVRYSRGIKQAPLLVLWKTTMPSVLVEIGFISNPQDRAKLSRDERREEVAACIFSAFEQYKMQYESGSDFVPVEDAAVAKDTVATVVTDGTVAVPAEPVVPVPENAYPAATGDTLYAVQFFAASRELDADSAELEGYQGWSVFQDRGLYKYYFGGFKNRGEALEKLQIVRRRHPGAFIIRFGPDGKPLR